MEYAQEIQKKLYQNIGKLFYAITASDRVVREEEVKKLKQIISTEWIMLDAFEDEFGSDDAYQIEIVFDWLSEQSSDAKECFKEFKLFKIQHEKLFNPCINKLILKTASSIASSFSGKNKSELIMLSELYSLLNK